MKRIIPFVAAVLVALSAQAQTVNVNLANGQTVKYNAGNVEDITFTERIAKPSEDDPEHFRAVDLGLPSGLLWASHNIGAKKYYDAGAFFAWGETSPKNKYNWESYMWGYYDSTDKKIYVNKYSSADGLTTLTPADDAAAANWGDGWRMPTKEDFEELLENTTAKLDHDDETHNVNGIRLTSKKNGKVIFLPCTGEPGMSSMNDIYGLYWTSTLDAEADGKAVFYGVNGATLDVCEIGKDSRCLGHIIRPVKAGE